MQKESLPCPSDVQCPRAFLCSFSVPVAVPWHESGQFLACLLFHRCYILSLSLLGWVSGPQRSAALISFSSSAYLARMCPCPIVWRSGSGSGNADFTNQNFLVELFISFWEFITQPISGSGSWHLQPNLKVSSTEVRHKLRVCSHRLAKRVLVSWPWPWNCFPDGSKSALTTSLDSCSGTGAVGVFLP